MLASSPAEGEGSSGRAPTPSNQRGRTPDAGPAVLHPLRGERQIPAYPPAIGDGSSAHPTSGHPKLSLLGDLCLTRGTDVRCQSPQRDAPLHPLQGERRMLASSPAEGEGSSGRAPTPSNQRGRTPDAGPAPLHPLLGERQTPYPPAIGEESSAHPSPGYAKLSREGETAHPPPPAPSALPPRHAPAPCPRPSPPPPPPPPATLPTGRQAPARSIPR